MLLCYNKISHLFLTDTFAIPKPNNKCKRTQDGMEQKKQENRTASNNMEGLIIVTVTVYE
jgi:hypothetical protein